MRYSEDFEVVCNYTMPMVDGCNESDEQLKKHRAEARENGYDADVNFQIFINHSCIDFTFDLFGLDVNFTLMKSATFEFRQKVYRVLDVVYRWFKGKTVDDISEQFYNMIELELGSQAFAAIS